MSAWIFRLPEGKQKRIIEELKEGRLRQCWGLPGMELKCGEEIMERSRWVYKNLSNEAIVESWGRECREKLRQIYDSLKYMLEIEKGDLLFIPKFEDENKFALVQARDDEGVYHHDEGLAVGEKSCDYIHYITVDAANLQIFSYDDLSVPNALRRFVSRGRQKDLIRPLRETGILYMLDSCRNKKKERESGDESGEMNLQESELRREVGALLAEFKNWLQDLSRAQLETVVENLLLSDGFVIEDREVYDGFCGDIDIIASRPLNVLGRRERFEVLVQIDGGECIAFSGQKARLESFIAQAEALNREHNRLIYINLSGEEKSSHCNSQEASDRGILIIDGEELARIYLENML